MKRLLEVRFTQCQEGVEGEDGPKALAHNKDALISL